LRLVVVSPFLDRQHGTELCVIEQLDRFINKYHWTIELYSQRVERIKGLRMVDDLRKPSQDCLRWHRLSEIPGPHLLKYLWWLFANHWRRWQDRRSGRVCSDLVYSPGINCLNADVIVVHVIFHILYECVRVELALQSTPFWSWPRLIHRNLYYRLVIFLERRIYTDPSVRLIAVSTLIAQKLKTIFGRNDVAIIPNAVDTVRFSPEACQARRIESRDLFDFQEQEFVILLIGNDWKNKGVNSLLRALTNLTDLPLRALIVGSDDPSVYRVRIKQLGLQDQIRFEKPRPDVLRFYAAADVYVGPSLEDAFSLPIAEAMACGLPVIASVHAGASENIRDGETGFLLQDPRDFRQLSRLLRQIAGDPALRSRVGLAASKYVRANCTWDLNVSKTREFLEATLRDRTRDTQ
jgi:UDP-glucose:(heptosyl)LPS alpha-1,3-glucosyltransferase